MSRFTAIIRIPGAGDRVERIECDIADVDGGGDLHLNRLGDSGPLSVSRFQHGHWASYELEPTEEAEAEELLRSGAITLNDFRKRMGIEPDTDCCADVPVKAEALPEVGETVHVWRKSGKIAGCCPMRVAGHCATESGVALALAGPLPWSPEFEQLLTSTHDETRTEHASWHWPCGGDDPDAAPKPDAPTPVSVTINVSGSVLSDRDLRDLIRKHLLNLGGLNPSAFRR